MRKGLIVLFIFLVLVFGMIGFQQENLHHGEQSEEMIALNQ